MQENGFHHELQHGTSHQPHTFDLGQSWHVGLLCPERCRIRLDFMTSLLLLLRASIGMEHLFTVPPRPTLAGKITLLEEQPMMLLSEKAVRGIPVVCTGIYLPVRASTEIKGFLELFNCENEVLTTGEARRNGTGKPRTLEIVDSVSEVSPSLSRPWRSTSL